MAGQREGDRIADQDGYDQRREHHDVEVFGHAAFFARRRSRSRRTQARPCTMSRMQKAGISDFSRNEAGMPPTEIGPSSTAHELRTEGQVNQATTIIEGSRKPNARSEEHTSELQSLMRISYAVFCLKKKTT